MFGKRLIGSLAQQQQFDDYFSAGPQGHSHDGFDSRMLVPNKCSIYTTSALNIANNSPTYISWNAEWFDTSNMHASGGSNIVIPQDGFYFVQAMVDWSGGGGGAGRAQTVILHNNKVNYLVYDTKYFANIQTTNNCSTIQYLLKDDIISMYLYQDSGFTQAVNLSTAADRATFLEVIQVPF